jgi:gas vesicle protein
MPRQDTVDFLAAFAVGTVLGIGATLLLQPERSRKERVIRQLKPYRKQMRRSYGQAREAVRGGADATADITTEAIAAGRELLGEFRSEITKILAEARADLQESVQDQVKDLSKGVRRTRRKFGV